MRVVGPRRKIFTNGLVSCEMRQYLSHGGRTLTTEFFEIAGANAKMQRKAARPRR